VTRTPQLSIGIANYGATFTAGEWRGLLDLGRAADDAGVHRIIVVDHVVMGDHTENYQWGKFPVPPEAPWLEPLSVLSAIAAVTTRVRLGTGILIAPLRPAAFLAKQAATLDQLSGGRLDLGVGTGWQREEYDAEGISFEQRGQLLTDSIAACKVLWRDTPASFDGPTLSLRDIYCEPKPVQPGGVPLWIAGTLHARNLERIVQHGDAWIPIMGETVAGLADGARVIAEAWSAAGRDPSALQVRGTLGIVPGDIARSMESVAELLAAGATDIQAPLRAFAREPADAPNAMAELVRRFAEAI
jgi:probable F420-dependent oxidoreductase